MFFGKMSNYMKKVAELIKSTNSLKWKNVFYLKGLKIFPYMQSRNHKKEKNHQDSGQIFSFY